ncbi:MAG: DUF4883 family protein [Clostridium sp.]|uniref:DUF4883 family protein n=1 Tax=Clostridium sp. TaxID=1506 RepID=UPI003F354D25
MKKIFLSLFFITIILLSGCSSSSSRYLNFTENKDKNYYFEEINNKLKNKEDFTVEVFDANFHKTYDTKGEYNEIITNFFSALTTESFVEPIDKKANKKIFEVILTFESSTYYLTIINENYLYISPYDGYVSSDFINMSSVPLKYNLYEFCNFIAEKREPM